MDGLPFPVPAPRIWAVGALCRAVADALDARFNPVAVRGEVSGFSRAPSGHCYFTLKDAQGQVRCAMFRRAASLLGFVPRDGDLVEVQGRLGVYEQRGDLQLVVESLARAGQGAHFEQFLRLKARLDAEGLFDPGRKRPLPALPRAIGIATSLNAAALHDVVTCLRRRAPHVAVTIAPAAVQGPQAPGELVAALDSLYALATRGQVDVILLVRGGGPIEDLWAFNDEQLARAIVRSPVPLVSGVGHETDFTIADFCADVRAPTPTAAAELAAAARDDWVSDLAQARDRLWQAAARRTDRAGQRLDHAAARLGRPLARAAQQRSRVDRAAQRLGQAVLGRLRSAQDGIARRGAFHVQAMAGRRAQAAQRLDRLALRLQLLDPRLVLQRGYALLTDPQGHPITSVAQTHAGQQLHAALADGEVAVTVSPGAANRP
ncbi:exodeoxyribonuclease VII large subunit [Caenimonas sedimenti]|uniref:Exodeoxyribonuclease 7 large subunit n=1 Tax=Caenimonas sedimenti TaxID=2596921 RepID=A0A562ZMZ6_9BURK|nr:exodeoxyribonuclease VII large subunit [Caenimonas sedimenti]TWO69962.1 exodeoxyribonuclease VII large subunit [Caenimonas sedimenti]